jgi:hypothetical protein
VLILSCLSGNTFYMDALRDQLAWEESEEGGDEGGVHQPLMHPTDETSDLRTVSVDTALRQRHRSRSSSFVVAMAEGITAPSLEGFVDASMDNGDRAGGGVVGGGAVDTSLAPGGLPADVSKGVDVGGSSRGGSRQKKGRSLREIPWRAMFTHPTALTLFLNNWTFGWIGYMVLTELPSYLTDVLGEWVM